MISMTDQENRSPGPRMACHLQVHFGHQRTGGIYHGQLTSARLGINVLCHPVGAEQNHGTVGNFSKIFDKFGTLGAQSFDDVPVVHNLMPDEDRGAEQFKRMLYGADRALDSGTETSDVSYQNFHFAPLPASAAVISKSGEPTLSQNPDRLEQWLFLDCVRPPFTRRETLS
jgi:hypothetical protein